MPVTASARVNRLRQHAQRFADFIRLPDGYPQFFAATQISRRSLRRRVYTQAFWSVQEGGHDYAELEREYFGEAPTKSATALERFLFADLTLNMPSAMLTRLDRASMAHSVEGRVPFLSHKMVDWALTVPPDMKLRGNVGKFILREAVAPWLPPATMKRPKQGFQMPLADWMRGDSGGFAREVWNDSGSAAAGYLEPSVVEQLFDEHRRGAADHGRMLYAITVFGLWWSDAHARPVAASALAA